MMGLDKPETYRGWRNTKNKLCIKLFFLYTILSICTVNKTQKRVYTLLLNGVTHIKVEIVSFLPCLFDLNTWDMQYAMCVENYLHQKENCLIRKSMQDTSYSILSKFYRRPRRMPLCFQILNLPYTKLIVFLVFLRE